MTLLIEAYADTNRVFVLLSQKVTQVGVSFIRIYDSYFTV